MAIAKSMLSSASPEWYTPPDLLADVRAFLSDYYDPCPASRGNLRENGLAASWTGQRVYCNPPYGRDIAPWIRKAMTEPVREMVLLVPARTDTAWFQPLYDWPICFLRGRLAFSGAATNAPFPSALVYRGRRVRKFAEAFAHRGVVVRAVPQLKRGTLWEVSA